ncbi:BTB/POZ protein, partial [Phakopsora pachyrhizi]
NQSGSKYVTLVSDEGYRFIIPKQAAILSNTLKDMLSEDMGMLEAESGVVNLMHSGPVVEKLCEYLIFKYNHLKLNEGNNQTGKSNNDLSYDFDSRIPIELALQLLECSDFLDI